MPWLIYWVVDLLFIGAVHLYYGTEGRLPWHPVTNQFDPQLTWSVIALNFFNIFTLAALLECFYFDGKPLTWTESWSLSGGLLLFGLFYTDIFSWLVHRAMHHPLLYRKIHSWHHQFYSPYAWVSFYCHPVENLVFNLGNVIGPLLVFQPSHLLGKLWALAALINSIRAHSIEAAHDYHHRYLKVEYGTNVFMDRLLGTHLVELD